MRVNNGRKRVILATIPLIAASVLLFGAATELLPIYNVLKITAARLLIFAGLASLLVLHGPRKEIFKTGLEIPIALLVLATVVVTIKVGMGGPQLRFLIESIALFYLVVALCRTDAKAVEALALVALVGVAAAASEGVAQVAQGDFTGFYRVGFTPVTELGAAPEDSIRRAIGSFANPNLLATSILLLAPLAAVTAGNVATRQLKVVVWGVVGIACLALILTFSRAGVGAALLGIFVALFATTPHLRKLLLLILAGAVAALLVGVLLSSGRLVSGFGRPLAYTTAFEVIDNNRTFGIGLGRAADVMNATTPKSSFRHAHNFWLTWWVEAGPIALISVIWISIALLVKSLRGAISRNRYSIAALIALVGFFSFGFLDHPSNVNRIATIFWVIAAIAVAAPTGGRTVKV